MQCKINTLHLQCQKITTAPGGFPAPIFYIMNNLFTTLSMIAAANPAGFTFNVETNEIQATGYAVALAASQNSFGADGLESVINLVTSADCPASCVGGWMDTESGLYYYDATVIIEDRAAAIAFGRLQGQIAIFDLNTMTEIRL